MVNLLPNNKNDIVKEDNPKNKVDPKNKDNLKNEYDLKKWRQPQKWRQSQKWERPQKWRQYSRNFMPTPPVPTVQIWDSIDVGGGRDIAENSRPPWLSLDFEIWILGMRGRDKPDNSRPPQIPRYPIFKAKNNLLKNP